jgi:hypothetical protein
MTRRFQFSLRALFVLLTVCCFIFAYREALPITAFLVLAILLILGPIRLTLDTLDRAVMRIKGPDRFD